MSLAHKGRRITLVALVCVAAVYVRALAFTPVERLQGPAQKIFYLHVPAALWTEAAMILVGLAGTFYLFLKDPRLDRFAEDRKSTRLNSSHVAISYAVFCLKKKNMHHRDNEHYRVRK